MPIYVKCLIFLVFNQNPNMSRDITRNWKPEISGKTDMCGLKSYMHTERQPDRGGGGGGGGG
jgi:hypothetical protein